MPINSGVMLPKRVRKMELLEDMLQVEQQEHTQTQRTIAGIENQLVISTSTFLLTRHEQIFDLQASGADSLEARRARVLAKLNTRGTTTVAAIRELVKIVTGRSGDVVEQSDQDSFSIIIYLLFTDMATELRELAHRGVEITPAHLVFAMVGAFEPVPLVNGERFSFHLLIVRSSFSNARGEDIVRFDGSMQFDGSHLFDQTQSGIQFPRLTVSSQFKNEETLSGTVLVDSWYPFDGAVSFDGSRRFNAQITKEEL